MSIALSLLLLSTPLQPLDLRPVAAAVPLPMVQPAQPEPELDVGPQPWALVLFAGIVAVVVYIGVKISEEPECPQVRSPQLPSPSDVNGGVLPSHR